MRAISDDDDDDYVLLDLKLYKNVFSPEVGRGLAFVGFVQPASGGILSMSEMQARWFAELCKESVSPAQ